MTGKRKHICHAIAMSGIWFPVDINHYRCFRSIGHSCLWPWVEEFMIFMGEIIQFIFRLWRHIGILQTLYSRTVTGFMFSATTCLVIYGIAEGVWMCLGASRKRWKGRFPFSIFTGTLIHLHRESHTPHIPIKCSSSSTGFLRFQLRRSYISWPAQIQGEPNALGQWMHLGTLLQCSAWKILQAATAWFWDVPSTQRAWRVLPKMHWPFMVYTSWFIV